MIGCRLSRHQQHETDGEQHRHHDGADTGNGGADDHNGDSGADGPLEHRTRDAFNTVGRQQLFGGQNSRQDGAVGGEEERGGDTQGRGGDGHMPDLQCANQSRDRDRRDSDDIGRLIPR